MTESDRPERRAKMARKTTVINEALPTSQAKVEASLLGVAGRPLGKRYLLARRRVTIGRTDEADIQIDETGISRVHAEIVSSQGRFVLRDLDSTNGTFVNAAKVGMHVLEQGDQIQIGKAVFKFFRVDHGEGQVYDEMYRQATVDELTGAHNRRHFQNELTQELGRSLTANSPLALVLFDIDHFKKFNDTYGHLAGDHVLRTLAARVRTVLRQTDLFARYGGEEFAIVLPRSTSIEAASMAQRVLSAVSSEPVEIEGKPVKVTISAGVADIEELLFTRDASPGTGQKPEDLSQLFIALADSKLYEAKEAGRNRVVF